MSTATINDQDCNSVRLTAPYLGAWFAEAEIDADALPTGRVTLAIGDTSFSGTVDASRSSIFAGRARAFIVGGAGGWGAVVPATQPYHNDGGVRRSQVAADIARAAGETVVVSSALDGPVGADWTREAAPASRLLVQLFPPGTVWYVGSDGVTRVGPRTARDVSTAVQLVEHFPADRAALVAIEESDVSVVLPGVTFTDLERLGSTPFVVRETVITVDGTSLRAMVYEDSISLVAGELVRERVPRLTFLGMYRYRVYQMAQERVRLQVFNKTMGLPDELPISIWPGMAGLSAQLTPGAIVLVQFVDGDPGLPIVTHFTREGDPGFLPVSLAIDATSEVAIGESALDVLIAAALGRILRDGEKVSISGLLDSLSAPVTVIPAGALITLHASVVAPGAPGVGYSKAKA